MRNRLNLLFSEFDGLTEKVSRSGYKTFTRELGQWLNFLEDTPEISRITSELEGHMDFDAWQKTSMDARHRQIIWPQSLQQRLGIQLHFFRRLANGDLDFLMFATDYLSIDASLDALVTEFVDRIFGPSARELRRFIEQPPPSRQEEVPASDRFVTLDHNSALYEDAIEAIDRVLEELERSRAPDPDDKNQRLHEIAAGQELLQARRVRIVAVKETIWSALRYLSKTFADTTLGKAAMLALEKLLALFGRL